MDILVFEDAGAWMVEYREGGADGKSRWFELPDEDRALDRVRDLITPSKMDGWREHRAAEHERRSDAEPAAQRRGNRGAEQPADRPGAEHQPEFRRPDVQPGRHVQHEDREEHEVEVVHRGGRAERRADDRRPG